MTDENIDLVRSTFAAFQRGDEEEFAKLVSDDLDVYRAEPDGAQFRGREGLMQATAEWTEDFQDWTLEPAEFAAAGDHVVVRVHQTATGAQSGVPVEGDIWFVFEISERTVVHLGFYVREHEAREAAGIPR